MTTNIMSPSAIAAAMVGQELTFLPEDVLRPDRPVQTVRVLEFLTEAPISQTENGPAFRVSITYKTKKDAYICVERVLGFKRFGDYLALAIQQEGQHEPVVKPPVEPKPAKATKTEVPAAEEAPVETPAMFVTENVLTDRQPNRKERKAAEKAAKAAKQQAADLTDVPTTENVEEYLDLLAEA